MYRRYLKILSIVMIASQLHGCGVATYYVHTIGAIDISGSKEVKMQNSIVSTTDDKINVDIHESELTVGLDKVKLAYLKKNNNKQLGHIELDFKSDKWLNKECNYNSQLVVYTINGINHSFTGVLKRNSQNNCVISLDNFGRQWYGYPAQSLMILSVPIDIAITAAITFLVLKGSTY